MHRTPASLIACLTAPVAAIWLRLHEEVILLEGRSLTGDEIQLAGRLGVIDPESVRIRVVEEIRLPVPGFIAHAARRFGIPLVTPAAMSLNLGIYLDESAAKSREILAHELTHTVQYQRLGGILPFLRQYIRECLEYGYQHSPMEIEARHKAKTVVH